MFSQLYHQSSMDRWPMIQVAIERMLTQGSCDREGIVHVIEVMMNEYVFLGG